MNDFDICREQIGQRVFRQRANSSEGNSVREQKGREQIGEGKRVESKPQRANRIHPYVGYLFM